MEIQKRLLCKGNANVVLNNIIEIINIIHKFAKKYKTEEEWVCILPTWFIQQCSPPMTKEESEIWLAHWRNLPIEKQAEMIANKKWSLNEWLYWIAPEHMTWNWKNGEIQNVNEIIVKLSVEEMPVALGAFDWLARASGAENIISND